MEELDCSGPCSGYIWYEFPEYGPLAVTSALCVSKGSSHTVSLTSVTGQNFDHLAFNSSWRFFSTMNFIEGSWDVRSRHWRDTCNILWSDDNVGSSSPPNFFGR